MCSPRAPRGIYRHTLDPSLFYNKQRASYTANTVSLSCTNGSSTEEVGDAEYGSGGFWSVDVPFIYAFRYYPDDLETSSTVAQAEASKLACDGTVHDIDVSVPGDGKTFFLVVSNPGHYPVHAKSDDWVLLANKTHADEPNLQDRAITRADVESTYVRRRTGGGEDVYRFASDAKTMVLPDYYNDLNVFGWTLEEVTYTLEQSEMAYIEGSSLCTSLTAAIDAAVAWR